MIIEFLKFLFRRNGSTPSSLDSWHEQLDRIKKRLQGLIMNSESSFLQVGESLQHLYQRARIMSDLSTRVASRLSGEELRHDMDVLQALLEQVRIQDDYSRKGMSTLTSLQDRICHLQDQLGTFSRTIKNLHALSNLIRIETARLRNNETGFTALSDDVRRFAGDVTKKSSDLTELTEKMLEIIVNILKRMKEFERVHKVRALIILEQAEQGLAAVESRYQSSDSIIRDIAARWLQISRNINEVVTSMQFHDITRQRIEHVCDAIVDIQNLTDPTKQINEMDNKLWNNPNSFPLAVQRSNEPASSKIGLVIPLCEVQAAQLQHASDDFASAIDRISSNLISISGEIAAISDKVSLFGRSDSKGSTSFLSDFQERLTQLSKSMVGYWDINREWQASLEQVSSTISGMSEFIRDIEKIGIETKILALNACVQAAHIGDEGVSLGVLADSIRDLSTETTQKMDEISASMTSIMDEAGSLTSLELRQNSIKYNAHESETEVEILQMTLPLKKMDQEISDQLIQIEQDGKSIIREINTSTDEISAHKSIESEMGIVIEGVRELVEGMRSLNPSVQSYQKEKEIEGLLNRYTMEQEREIHNAILVSAESPILMSETAAIEAKFPPVEEGEISSKGPSTDNELGDNVELF